MPPQGTADRREDEVDEERAGRTLRQVHDHGKEDQIRDVCDQRKVAGRGASGPGKEGDHAGIGQVDHCEALQNMGVSRRIDGIDFEGDEEKHRQKEAP